MLEKWTVSVQFQWSDGKNRKWEVHGSHGGESGNRTEGKSESTEGRKWDKGKRAVKETRSPENTESPESNKGGKNT